MADIAVINGSNGAQTRLKDMGGRFYANEVAFASAAIALLWTDATAMGTTSSVVSGWVDVGAYTALKVGRTVTGAGTYAFEIDWGRSSGVVDFVETVAVGEAATISKDVAATWARFRARNSSAVTAFSAHRTNVFAR